MSLALDIALRHQRTVEVARAQAEDVEHRKVLYEDFDSVHYGNMHTNGVEGCAACAAQGAGTGA